ncbi:MAG TPA: S-methyl-5'-thioadenosine phosphorylase, partial [Vicinamibacteria bacterium]|nr:S-methyl-5'-thioadenosine phosphorylase [Vicinamibacteria bacterium]
DVETVELETPFGKPSAPYVLGQLEGKPVAFLARHGEGHRLLPSELNFRANLFGFKLLGVEHVLSASAVGSLREDIHPLDVVVPDQFIDRTRGRVSTFFGNGIAAHVEFSRPFCQRLSNLVHEAGIEAGARMHRGGIYVCIEGPQFSTLAESELYRSWGGHIIGMTNLQEAKLAREAEMSYATLALVTDYDCWHVSHASVTVEQVIENLFKNAEAARQIITRTIARLDLTEPSPHANALATSIITQRDFIPEHIKRDLAPLIGKYID